MVGNDVHEGYLGCPCKLVTDIKKLNNKLNAEVVEQVNDTQELVMLNNFARESNEYIFKKCLQERISAISSWRWVLNDLSKRLQDGIEALRYEHHAITVVIERIVDELNGQCKPGALGPVCDDVEEAILQECDYLKDQKKKFENLLRILDVQINMLDETRKNIDSDILNKQQALVVEESCGKICKQGPSCKDSKKKILKKKKAPVDIWEQHCTALKRAGLQALTNAIVTRQQVRGARLHLSITAQSYAARVDSVLRRRLHTNKLKLQDLNWQKEEAIRNHNTLDEELRTTEQNLLQTMDQESVIVARIADRNLRPSSELTTDEVDRNMKEELARLKNFIKVLQQNHCRIITLRNHLTDCKARVECCVQDISQVIKTDEERILHRLGEYPSQPPNSMTSDDTAREESLPRTQEEHLEVIREENEEVDDYPFDF